MATKKKLIIKNMVELGPNWTGLDHWIRKSAEFDIDSNDNVILGQDKIPLSKFKEDPLLEIEIV